MDEVSETTPTAWTPITSLIEELQDAIDRVGMETFRDGLAEALHDILCDHDPTDSPYRPSTGDRPNRYQRHASALIAHLHLNTTERAEQ